MEQFQLPEVTSISLSFQGNLAENWRRWKERFEVYGRFWEECEVKFLHLAGPDALEVFNTFSFNNAGDDKKLGKLIEKFEAYCIPRSNVTWEKHVFNTRNQQIGENVDQYVTDLRKPMSLRTLEIAIA